MSASDSHYCRNTHLRDISRNDRRLGKEVKNIIQPRREMRLAILSKIHARDRPQLDAQRLQEDGEDIGHEHDEEQLELERSPSRNISGVVSCPPKPRISFAKHLHKGAEKDEPGSIYATATMNPGPTNFRYLRTTSTALAKMPPCRFEPETTLSPLSSTTTPRSTLTSPPTPLAPSHSFTLDRKSTRLNSSHMSISYAVFCLKKKN